MMKLEAIISIAHMWTQFLSSFFCQALDKQVIKAKGEKIKQTLYVCLRSRGFLTSTITTKYDENWPKSFQRKP